MIISDRIYGKFQISDPLISELIRSRSVQRLKNISMFGVPDEFYHLKNYSRFEHSVGVMILLKKLGADREEQIAGLLHDISHTAFSHVVDWVVGSGKTEDYQDKIHQQMLISSDTALILEKHGFDPERIANYHHFHLLEQPAPDLCADRLDYGLREIPKKDAAATLKGLVVFQGRICCRDIKSASAFAYSYLHRQIHHWGGLEAVSRYRLFADVLKMAISDKTIAFGDFAKTEVEILEKVQASKNQKVQKILAVLRKKSLNNLPLGKKVYHKKFRYVDPLVVTGGKTARLSTLDKNFKKELDKARRENEKGVRIPEMEKV